MSEEDRSAKGVRGSRKCEEVERSKESFEEYRQPVKKAGHETTDGTPLARVTSKGGEAEENMSSEVKDGVAVDSGDKPDASNDSFSSVHEGAEKGEEDGNLNKKSERRYCVKFNMLDDAGQVVNKPFPAALFRQTYKDVRVKLPLAMPRVDKEGRLEIWVQTKEEIDDALKMNQLADLTVCGVFEERKDLSLQLWGRISGVHPQFTEDDIMDELRNYDVMKVRRKTYVRRMMDSNGETKMSVANTGTVDILFQSRISSKVDICGDMFEVTLLAPVPLRCHRCLKFGHKIGECSEQKERCWKCGTTGHKGSMCRKELRCVNCNGEHSSSSSHCPVFIAKLNGNKQRYETRVANAFGGKIVRTAEWKPPVTTSTPTSSNQVKDGSGVQRGMTYAKAVARRAVMLEGAEEPLCYLKEKTVSRQTLKKCSCQRALQKENTDGINSKITTIIKLLKDLIESDLEDFPDVLQVLSRRFDSLLGTDRDVKTTGKASQ